MNLSKEELKKENDYLENVIKVINDYISSLGQELYEQDEKVQEFKKFIWDNKSSLDPTELKALMSDSDLEVYLMQQKGKYFQKLYKIQNNPYFGSISFTEDNGKKENVYIGITHLEEEDNYLIHDWRSPICSLFYDFDLGDCFFKAPGGIIKGKLTKKRQYNIKNKKLVHVFDNNINIDDELLQEVLASESSDKMKNIVNTIQHEQNRIIRNVEDKNLIVQGIAGSGKTSVALHRIAFLLYKIENLNSNNVLIFSPNSIFTEYISNVLPELGEDNTMQTTFSDFLYSNIYEYKNVESFISFICRYYKYLETNYELVKYKQSDEIIEDINNYIDDFVNSLDFKVNITDNILYDYSVDYLNRLFHDRYSKFSLFERIKLISIKLSEINYDGKKTYAKFFNKKLLDSLELKKDFKKIYYNFFKSKYCRISLTDNEIRSFVNKNSINYEDACLFVYMKGLLESFDYNNNIKQIVIDEAQDYNRLQYVILSKIFKKASFTILGDINQTINPYYKYNSLEDIGDLFGSYKYLELNKTYRSTKEIIDYTNKILGLNHVSAIRRDNVDEVLIRNYNVNNLKELLEHDILELKKRYNNVAIITKDDREAEMIYNLFNGDITLVCGEEEGFKKDLVVIPAYVAKGLEFDSVIVYNEKNNVYQDNEKYLYYVACTRAQHKLIIYN